MAGIKFNYMRLVAVVACGVALLTGGVCVSGEEPPDLREQVRQLQLQNDSLQQQLEHQQQIINSLDKRLTEFQTSTQHQATAATAPVLPAPSARPGLSFGAIQLSGEAGAAFFQSGRDGQYPHGEFRIDEAKLFIDAQVFDNVFFFTELNLTQRESPDEFLSLGEIYFEIEDISRFWGQPHQLNVRAGRMDIPFGEEYMVRDAVDNPLIMHSLSDVWGVDEGVELYGGLGRLQYVLAVQNGGPASLSDANGDKSVSGRLGVDPTQWLHLSASGMRTGNLQVKGDQTSAVWFGNGFFRAIGAPATTTHFQADLAEADIQLRLPHSQVKTAGGYAHFSDNDTASINRRDLYYYSVEGLYNVTPKLYAATRFSQIFAPGGYPLVGSGNFNDYFFTSPTKNLWRLSLGGGYRWQRNLTLKVEYMLEQGTEIGGDTRHHEDVIATEVTGKF